MAKVFVGVGHGGNDPGAVGYLREEDVNLQMALGCEAYLKSKGVEVLLSRYKDENDILGKVDNPEEYYINVIMKDKLKLNIEYIEKSNIFFDIYLIVKTIVKCI